MNPALSLLHPYPFEKLAALTQGIVPPGQLSHINLSIGEPKHPAPAFVLEVLQKHMSALGQYPATKGIAPLREAIAHWASARYQLTTAQLNPELHVLPVAGTREALFSIVQAAINPQKPNPTVVMPNPFYQIYEGAALLAGAQPYFLDCSASTDFIPDFAAVDARVWDNCQVLFICSPGNPTGKFLSMECLQALIALADKHDFIIASDECYSELYLNEAQPPVGLLQACQALNRLDFKRCLVFHSLSKRSNLPGLRSGFVAGDAALMAPYLRYRTYQGCALPVPTQWASAAAWQDETHVVENRRAYREKFAQAQEILQPHIALQQPEGGFYFWLKTPSPGVEFARQVFSQCHITLLPGEFLAREGAQGNPGKDYVRMALVADAEQCQEACHRLANFLGNR
jgi:N-succinyldiaminopimelate aminotransferase